MANLETEEPGSEVVIDIRERLGDVAKLRTKKQRQLEAVDESVAVNPDPEPAEDLISALPLLDVDWKLLSDEDFRDLLEILSFEAHYDPESKSLTIKVVLIPELLFADDPPLASSLLFVPPGRIDKHLQRAKSQSRPASRSRGEE